MVKIFLLLIYLRNTKIYKNTQEDYKKILFVVKIFVNEK